MPRPLAALLGPLLLALLSGGPAAGAVSGLAPPVEGEVVARFDAPTRYGAGHRGVDLRATPGTVVAAPAGGTVAFAGAVVGSRWVTVDHGGLRSTVGPLATIGVRAGDVVAAGAALGTSGHAHGLAAVHWSVRRGETYLDPLAAAGPRVATLLPTDGWSDVAAPGPVTSWTAATDRGPWRGRVR